MTRAMTDQPDRRPHLRTAAVGLGCLLVGLALGILLAPPATAPQEEAARPTPTPSTTSTPTPTATEPDPAVVDTGEQTPEGAVRAALGWLRLFTTALYLDDEARQAAVADVAAADAEEDLQARTAEIADRFREIGLTPEAAASGVRIPAPVGYEVREFSQEEAEVAVWIASVLDLGQVAPLSATWHTQITLMRWEDGGWRLVSVDTVDGPVPDITQQGDGQLAETLEVIESFTEFTSEP